MSKIAESAATPNPDAVIRDEVDPLYDGLEALVSTCRQDIPTDRKAREIVRRILHGDDPA